MEYLAILKLVLQLAAWVSRRVDRANVEKAFGDALVLAIDQRSDAADAARNDVLSGRVPDDPGPDPNQRD